MGDSDRRFLLLRRMAWLCAALVIAITSLSAYIRLTKAGLGCADWPQCYGQSLREAQGFAPAKTTGESAATAAARLAHRVVAMAALLLVIMMAMTCFTMRPLPHREGRLALALLACVVFLAVLGRWTSGARVPAVAIGNLLGGFVMLALCGRMARSAGFAPVRRRALGAWAWVGVALLLTQVASGGLVSAGFAGLSCPDLSGCDASGVAWQTLDPWREPVLDGEGGTNPVGALASGLHRAGAFGVALVVVPLAIAVWRAGRRREAALVLALLGVQAGLGAMLVVGRLPLAAALAHNLVAALLLAAVLDLTFVRETLR